MSEPAETPTLCLLCPADRARRCRDGGVTCTGCHDRLAAQLEDIAERFGRITAAPTANGNGRRAPGFGSKPPVNLHNATLRDPRTAPAKAGGLHSPVNLAVSWAGWIRRARRQAPVGHVVGNDAAVLASEIAYLLASLDWITRQPWVVRLAEQTRAVYAQVCSATGDRRPRPVGRCTHLRKDANYQPCNHPLFPPRPGRIDVKCGGCGAEYAPLDQARMVKASIAA